jgi:hypothetical protein
MKDKNHANKILQFYYVTVFKTIHNVGTYCSIRYLASVALWMV